MRSIKKIMYAAVESLRGSQGYIDEFVNDLGTVSKDGVPHVVPVWYSYDGKKFRIGTNTKLPRSVTYAPINGSHTV